jgi:hypothetical protein
MGGGLLEPGGLQIVLPADQQGAEPGIIEKDLVVVQTPDLSLQAPVVDVAAASGEAPRAQASGLGFGFLYFVFKASTNF